MNRSYITFPCLTVNCPTVIRLSVEMERVEFLFTASAGCVKERTCFVFFRSYTVKVEIEFT